MRWPLFGRQAEQGEQPVWQDDDVQDDEQYDDAEDGDEQEDAEPEIPEAALPYVEKARAAAREEALAQVRAAAAKRGMAFTGDDLAVADFGAFHSNFGAIGGQPQPAQPAGPQQPPEEAPDEMPDPSYDAAGFQAWLARDRQRTIRETVAALKPEIESLRGQFQARDAVGDAVERAREMLPDLGFGHIVEHPEFERHYRETLLGNLRPDQWNDPHALAAAAGAIAPVLRERGGFQQQQRRARDEAGRYQREDQARMLGEFGASRSSGRPMRGTPPTREERQLMTAAQQLFGMNAEEWNAADDETGRALKSVRDRARNGKR